MAGAFDSTGMANPGGVANSSTFYSDPQYVQNLLKSLTGQQQQLGNYLQNPTASPIFQGQLSGLLNAMKSSEQNAVTGLNDMFRGAGNTASSVYGGAAQGLQSDILGKHYQAAGGLLSQVPQIAQALLGQMGLTPQILNALKLQQQQGARPGSTDQLSQSLGLNTPMAGNSMGPAGGGSYAQTPGYMNSGVQGWGGVNPMPQVGYGPNGSLTQAEYNSYYGPGQNAGSTMFLPGGQMVGPSTPSNNAIYDQLTGGSGGGSTYYDQQGGNLLDPSIFQ